MTKRVLIANRGEIACRIIKTCRKLGFESVAVYSDADKDALHVSTADEAYHIGPSPVRDSYLRMEKLIDVAQKAGATLVHPGYGLLSENPEFAARVEKAGLKWVGPSPDTIRAMGNKARAREIAQVAGVPTVPGTNAIKPDELQDYEKIGEEIGFPILIKAVAGGGGIGMRVCENPAKLKKFSEAVSEMAERTFGDPAVILERYIPQARHVEIQVFGLGDGDCLTLFERDCSAQRRFQKVVEEAPAPFLPQTVRDAMTEAARSLASNQKYSGAGTVEFIVDCRTNEFFFLEMNTRLQVEHPVTEMITGLDIVEMQLLLALGDDVDRLKALRPAKSGHAIECRIYAEDPNQKFYPSPGTITRYRMPKTSDNVRIDTGVFEGSMITPYYDPLIAKLTCCGKTRAQALDALHDALGVVDIQGVKTNTEFLGELVGSDAFTKGRLHTRMIDELMEERLMHERK